MSNELHVRSLRTLDLFVTELVRATRRQASSELRRHGAEASRAAPRCRRGAFVRGARAQAEARVRLRSRLELMIETPQSILARRRHVRPARARRGRPGPRDGRALRRLRLHRALRHHRLVAAHAPSGLRLREAHDAGRARAIGDPPFRRRHEHHAGSAAPRGRRSPAHRTEAAREPRRRAPRVEAALRRCEPLAA